ncbi:dephospho-CoA kinase [Demequina lignilytica]|uniref:Dephospho-CoA kinase n=1 Tax=Demequina lignilytica TaxID=3051663 RepID=A0AAW7M2N5_9MICO|nr:MULTISPECIES: dephospho-CoA kinase [unclassified Demequina]MDN4479008.1 dephospho-CoA kinase [Demequina sp. SYSU T00039-1]MDN4484516.1 dephospho-CoA kinase [Demequina sp. SYSU T0a273]MDN4489073.1 dephospho-CoA kinase [Demequina sp. SYSU T00039]
MLRIGLTGGIASGKSTALARFAELGARVVDHDQLSRRAVAPGSAALADIAREFGPRLIVKDELDRGALAQIVFADDHALARLNSIVHPYVMAMGQAADRQARAEGVRVIVHDIPLLVETGQDGEFDLVVTVAAELDTRVRRMIESRGMTEDDARARIRAQATDEQRAAAADVVLDGNATPEHLARQVDDFWHVHVPS